MMRCESGESGRIPHHLGFFLPKLVGLTLVTHTGLEPVTN